jgi:hypothetical protein
MLLRLLFMLFSGEGEHQRLSKQAAAARRKRAMTRLNKAKQNRPPKKLK